MKHTNEVQAILTAIFAINRTSEYEDKDITLVLDYAFRRLFGANTNLLILSCIAELKKYLGYEFSSGSYTGDDYKSFQTKYINYLKAVCRENHWQLVNVGRNHYCFSAFIKSAENKCVYISISDVRYFTNEWYSNILIRTAKDEQDYRGGFNHHTTLEDLTGKAAELLEDLPF